VLHAARWNTGRKKIAKKSASGHHRTTLSGYIFATKACINNRKNLLNSNISSICPHNMVNFGSPTAEICWRVWGTPANLNRFRVLASYTDVAQWRSTKLCRIFGHLLGWQWYTIYTFLGLLSHKGILQAAKSLCVRVLRSPILVALLHGTRAAAVSRTLWRGTRNWVTELSQTAPPIFGWAAITLGIDRPTF